MENNIETIKQYLGCYRERNLEKFVSFLALDFVHRSSLTQPVNRDYMAKGFTAFVNACPNIKEEVISIMADGDKVMCEVLETGTLTHPLLLQNGVVIEPNNRSYKLPFAIFFRFDSEGLIAEQRVIFDSASLARQTGIDISKYAPQPNLPVKD
jgi:predicted ester cyclase